MTTPNLDSMGHQWVGTLVQFNFEPEYQKGHDNTVADALRLSYHSTGPRLVRSILDGVTLGTVHQAIVEGDHCLEQEVCVTAGHALMQMYMTD